VVEESFEYPVELLVSNNAVYVLRQGTPDSVTDYWVQSTVPLKSILVRSTNHEDDSPHFFVVHQPLFPISGLFN
jgi:hypothetical protein